MNAGFSSLTALKAQLLNESLRSDTTYDALILAVGLGVAGKFDGACNRKFARVAGETYTTLAGRRSLILPRYPIEAVTAVDLRENMAEGWQSELGSLDFYQAESGLVRFSDVLGQEGQIRVTYTGGYWWSTDGDGSATAASTTTTGAVAIASGARSVDVVFSTALAAAPAGVMCNVMKPTVGGSNFAATVRGDSITANGCTVDFSGPIPATGYQLSYFAMVPGAVIASDATQPAGSTLLPEAIRTAWLLQCEHVWRRRDKLGLSISSGDGDKAAPGLGDLDLIPLVKEMLRDYVRMALT